MTRDRSRLRKTDPLCSRRSGRPRQFSFRSVTHGTHRSDARSGSGFDSFDLDTACHSYDALPDADRLV